MRSERRPSKARIAALVPDIPAESPTNVPLACGPAKGPLPWPPERRIEIQFIPGTHSSLFAVIFIVAFAVIAIGIFGNYCQKWRRQIVLDLDMFTAWIWRFMARAMAQGACGFSTGLIYRPGRWSATPEVIELSRDLFAIKQN